jgi:hypothetical protein
MSFLLMFNKVYIDWKYSQSCWYFRPALTISPVSSPPLPCVNKYSVYGTRILYCTVRKDGSMGVI